MGDITCGICGETGEYNSSKWEPFENGFVCNSESCLDKLAWDESIEEYVISRICRNCKWRTGTRCRKIKENVGLYGWCSAYKEVVK
jgi:hypothetical protein